MSAAQANAIADRYKALVAPLSSTDEDRIWAAILFGRTRALAEPLRDVAAQIESLRESACAEARAGRRS